MGVSMYLYYTMLTGSICFECNFSSSLGSNCPLEKNKQTKKTSGGQHKKLKPDIRTGEDVETVRHEIMLVITLNYVLLNIFNSTKIHSSHIFEYRKNNIFKVIV